MEETGFLRNGQAIGLLLPGFEPGRKCGVVQEEVTVESGWGRGPRGLYVVFRSAKARPFAERKANSATRVRDKCRMGLRPARSPNVVTLDGVSLFDVMPTVTNLLGEVFLPLRAIWHNRDLTLTPAHVTRKTRNLNHAWKAHGAGVRVLI
jgi:hypothetical protein